MSLSRPMQALIEGYRAFRNGRWPAERKRYEDLAANGQKPETLVIACSDSRCDPATIFDASPGGMFVIRNVAAIVPPYTADDGHHGTSAAIAFAVMTLQVKNILVMGHAQCGGVAAALDNSVAESIPFLHTWVNFLMPAVERTCRHGRDASCAPDVERDAVRLSLERLMSFPFIRERVQAGTLELNGARFGIANGELEILNTKTGAFTTVE